MRLFYQTKDSMRAFRVRAVICLIVLQAVAFLFAPLSRSHVQNDIPGVSLALAGAICGDDAGHSDPTHSSHDCQCMLCTGAGRDHWSVTPALLAAVVVLLTPNPEETSAALGSQDSPSLPSRRFLLPLSRGPPTALS